MPTLLRIDASARGVGSTTRALADQFQQRWLARHPQGRVIHRVLADDLPPHLQQQHVDAFQHGGAEDAACSEALLAELQQASELLVSSPLYNLGPPSPLKAWVDQVVRAGRSFELGPQGYRGLLGGRSATLITARGGVSRDGAADDFLTPWLQAVLAFMGVDSPRLVQLEATALPEPQRHQAWQRACAQLVQIFEPAPHEATWTGPFSEVDRAQIATLREAQAEAIVRGDPSAYAALCTPDVQLLLPGQPAVCGLAEFVALESRLLSPGRFVQFEKTPLRVERSGDLVVETGLQRVQAAGSSGIQAPQQKYVHVMRDTPEGWRYAVLTSNPCA